MKKTLHHNILILVVLPVLITALIGGLFSYLGMEKYQLLNLPSFTPPDILFPFMWGIIYLLMGISGSRIAAKETDFGLRRVSLFLFLLQLVINALWPMFFFTLSWLWFAFVWLLLLILLVGFMIDLFRRTDLPAAILQLPYFCWLTFAAVLNFSIAALN